MKARFLAQTLGVLLAAGFLSSGSCSYKSCSGDCDDHDHQHTTKAAGDRIRGYELELSGLPPGDVSRLLTRIHGPWLLADERLQGRQLADFAGRVVAANRDLFGLSPAARLATRARSEGDDLILETQVRDLGGPYRIAMRIESSGRLSAIRVYGVRHLLPRFAKRIVEEDA